MMKTRIRIKDARKLMLLLAFAITASSCFGDDDGVIAEEQVPELTIKVTDCPKENIAINPQVRITGRTGRWFVHVDVTITCMGEPVNEAELKVKWGWIEQKFMIKTYEEGKATRKQRVTSSVRPSGNVTVTIEGSDGEKSMTLDF